MILDPARRRRLVTVAAATPALLGCFAVGVISVRHGIYGLMLIGVLLCLIVYLTGPQRMVWIALFLAFAPLPDTLHVVKMIGPLGLYAYQAAVLVAILFLIPLARLRFSAYVLPAIFLLTVAFFTAIGVVAGHAPDRVASEASFLCETVAGFVLAMLIVRAEYVKESMRVMAVVLWYSAGMIVASSLTGLRLAGRKQTLEGVTGVAEAVRLLTAAEMPAVAVLTALVAAQIIGRGKPSVYLALGLPALAIALLSFSRYTLISLAVAAVVAFVTNWGWSAIRRSAMVALIAVAMVAVVVPGSLFLLQNTEAGAWLGEQFTAFSHRVVGGVSTTALAIDQSTLDRLHENTNLERAITKAPWFGHGLGYAYQLPFGKPGTFTATLGQTYAHNFYLWWLVKAGAVGMTVFAVFALTPVIRSLRSGSALARISAAVSLGLLAVCVVNPLPLDPPEPLVLGMALGAAMGFAGSGRKRERPRDPVPIVSGVGSTRACLLIGGGGP